MVNRVALGEVCDFIRGVAFDGNEAIDFAKQGYVPILRAGNIGDELYIHDDLVWVPEKRVSKEQLFQVGDIAICMASGSPAVLGKTAQLKENFIGSVGAFCGIIRPTKADPNYIAYWLKSPTFMAWRDSQANGANIQNLRPNEVREIEIPLPPLTEQKRIASLLARADRLRHLRRTAHELGESLLQSVFLEMFGDLHFPEIPLSELCHFITKGTTPQASDIKDFPSTGNDVPFLKVYHLTDKGKVDFDYSPSWVSNSIHNGLLNRSKVYPNDILMNIVGPPLGKFGIVPSTYKEWNVNQAIAIFRAKEKVSPIYLLHALMYPKILEKLLKQAVGVRQLNLSLEQCRDFRVPVPPLNLQEEFAGVVARVESLRGRMSEGERQVEGLFESLLAEAFS